VAALVLAGCAGSGAATQDDTASDADPQASMATDTTDIRTADYDVRALTYPELRDFEAPDPQRIELENGMVVFLLEDPELPLVSAVARVGAGSVYEPAEKRGLASVTGQVMRTGGTESMSSDSLNLVVANRGATVETGIGETQGTAFMSTLKENVDTILPIFADVIRRPAFAEEKVNLAKQQQKSGIARRNDSPSQIAARELDQLIYGEDSPYARVPEYYTIDRITRQDVVGFHEQYFRPNNTILSVWGDFDAEAMEAKIREQFGDWPAEEGMERPTPPEPEAQRQYSVNLVPKSDVTQSTIRMGHIGEMTLDNPDYPAVRVMNQVLSGGFSSRLFQNVRREQGLAYAVGGSYSAGYTRPGRFYARVGTKSSTTVEAAESVLEEVRRMQEAPPTDEELSVAKDSYLNSFVFNFDTQQEVLGRLMTYEYYDYPKDFLQQTRNAIEEVTAEDVQRVADKYLYPDEAHILVVGNDDEFGESLSALTKGGRVDTLDISIPREPPSETEAPPTAEEEEAASAGREAMMAAREALGGSAFDQIENMRIVLNQQGNENTFTIELPGKLYADIQSPMGAATVVDNGESMKLRARGQTMNAPAQVREQINSQLWRILPYLMARLGSGQVDFSDQGTTTVDGTTYRAVEVEPPVGDPFTLYLDPNTQRPQRLTFSTSNPQVGQVDVTQTFSDYREVEGMMMPFKTVTTQAMGGQEQTVESTIKTLEINVDLEEGLFTLSSN
jgi:predicted Zn-dependent peptidase/outer membrane lipoprotein-sorting protein